MATNQATNRDPVVTLDDDTVLGAVDELRSRQLVRVVLPSHGRSVKRYRHVLDEVYGLDAPRYALLATLLLRGPQTVGELRARTERMVKFASAGDVQEQLTVLAEHSEELARLLSRRPGQKEDRWQQIVAAPWNSDPESAGADGGRPTQISATSTDEAAGSERIYALQGEAKPSLAGDSALMSAPDQGAELEALRSELALLRGEVAALRQDLDALRQGLGG